MSVERTLKVLSRAEIIEKIADRLIRIVESENPEEVFVKMLRDYFVEVGFSEKFPNFARLNIGVVHPFIILLMGDMKGAQANFDVFPSITVADTSMDEAAETLAKDEAYIALDQDDVIKLIGYTSTGELHISDTGIAKLRSATMDGGKVVGRELTHTTGHTFDFNIWTMNRDVTSFIFDTVEGFLESEIGNLHMAGIDIASHSGRRTGDVNLDYGKLLYGANVSASVTIRHKSITVNPRLGTIASIDTTTLPTYFT